MSAREGSEAQPEGAAGCEKGRCSLNLKELLTRRRLRARADRSNTLVVDSLNRVCTRHGPPPTHARLFAAATEAVCETSLHAQRFEHRIHGIGKEAGLELSEQFSRNGRDVFDTRHRQQNSFGAGVEGDLQRLR